MDRLKQLVTELMVARREAARLAETRQALQRAWEEEHRSLLETASALARRVAWLESTIRETALAAFEATGETAPAPGVKLRRGVELSYDEREAIRWCAAQAESQALLRLDRRGFESVARTLQLPFVTVRPVMHVTIARNLEEVLDEAAA